MAVHRYPLNQNAQKRCAGERTGGDREVESIQHPYPWRFIVLLVVMAVGSVTAGILGHNGVFWAAVAGVFLSACIPVTLFAAKQLGISPEATEAVRSALRLGGNHKVAQ